MSLTKQKIIKFLNSIILIKTFPKILFFFLISSCISSDYIIESPDQNNNEEDQNQFAEIESIHSIWIDSIDSNGLYLIRTNSESASSELSSS